MFGSKIEAANARITALTALLTVAGLAISADTELPTPAAFKATLDGAQKKAVDEALASVNASLATQTATASAYASGLAAAGVKLGEFKAEDFKPKADAKEGEALPAATAVQTAVQTAIAAQSAKQIAATGHTAALDVAPTGDNSNSAEVVPATAAEFVKTHAAIKDPGERTAYFRKHKAKFAAAVR